MSHKFYTRYKNSGPRDCILLLRGVKVSVCLLASLLSGSELGGAAYRSRGSTEKAASGPPLGRVPHTQAPSTTAAMPGALASRLLPRLVSPLANAHPSAVPPPHSNLLQEKYLDRACLPCHELHTEGAKRRKVGSTGPQTTSEQFMPVAGVRGRGLRAWPGWGVGPQSTWQKGLGASRDWSFGGAVGFTPILSPFLSPPPGVSSWVILRPPHPLGPSL